MRGSRYRVVLLWALVAASSALLHRSALAQALDDEGRGPRFLLAPSGSVTETVQVDIGRTPVLRRRIALDLDGVTLKAALAVVAAQAGLELAYGEGVVPPDGRVHLRADGITVAAALTDLLVDANVDVVLTPEGRAILKRRGAAAGQPSGTVRGRVTDSVTTAPLEGAQVLIPGTALTATTNSAGRYQIAGVPAGTRRLIVRLVGYVPAERTVEVIDSQVVRLDVALQPGLTRLQELVTTATGPQRRMEVANQVTVIRADSIVQMLPIKDLTALLESRVPGLATLPTTGAPGDPSRLRLRGPSSILRSNDPIVIVDGVRIYAEQTQTRSASLGWAITSSGEDNVILGGVGAPSALDRIDPNSIETVEVLNGPSAATLYGADAANGVIVITTKQGRPGPARWDFSVTHGRSHMPGRFPDTYIGFGHSPLSDFDSCPLTLEWRHPACVVDSVVSYQALNDPEMTVLGRGHRSSMSATVSGGRPDIRYAITGTYSDEVGLLRLPRFEVDRFREAFGRNPEDWMERPHHLTKWSVASRFDFKPVESADVAVTMALAGDEQRRSNLEQQLRVLRGAYVDKTTGAIYRSGDPTLGTSASLVPDFYRRTTNRALGLKTGVNLGWRPFERFTVRADAGISADLRRDESMVPRGLRVEQDSLGLLSTGQGTVTMGSVNVGASYAIPLAWGFTLDAAVGFNYTNRSVADIVRATQDPAGGLSTVAQSRQSSDHLTSHGWYVEPRLVHKRFSVSTGLRIDGGSNYGTRASGFALPKLGGSWLISDEPFFPFKDSRIVNTLRLRAAYGQAGVQPGPADRLRLYAWETHEVDGAPVEVSRLQTLGNTLLRPERSTEIEGGFDADLLDSRLSVTFTAYRKTKNDALLSVPLPESVNGGGNTLINIGVVRNTGYEVSLGTNLVRTDRLSWSAQLSVSRNRNVVVSLAEKEQQLLVGGERVVAGYPLFGLWDQPILGYADDNEDGILQQSEIVLGDSVVFLGATTPDYLADLHTTVGLFGGALMVSGSFAYQDGFAQLNNAPGGALARAKVDPSAPLSDQVLVAADTRVGLIQQVSTLRFNSLAVNWRLPASLLRWVGAERGSLAVQGTNLGLRTNYRGKDPQVNSIATGNTVADLGALPRPREWQVRMNLSY